MLEPVVSVVVIGRNEGARLVRCLKSVQAMSHRFGPFEVIYVDSDSSDGSPAQAAALGAKVIELKGGRMSAARARNEGWQAAAAQFVLFLDGDTVLHPDFVTRALVELDNSQAMVVWGNRRELHPETSIYNRVLDVNWIYPPGLTEFCGGDALMRRSALEQAGGFNPDLIAGEEPDLCRRIRATGGLIPHIDAPMTGHDFAMTSWRQYWRHSYRAGHAYAEIAARYKDTPDALWKDSSRSNAIHACVYMLSPVIAVFAALLMHSWLPLLLFALAAAALAFRTALKNRSKPVPFSTLILFGIHSHAQQIPIFMGQLRYWRNARRNFQSELIEYKRPS